MISSSLFPVVVISARIQSGSGEGDAEGPFSEAGDPEREATAFDGSGDASVSDSDSGSGTGAARTLRFFDGLPLELALVVVRFLVPDAAAVDDSPAADILVGGLKGRRPAFDLGGISKQLRVKLMDGCTIRCFSIRTGRWTSR